MRYVMIAAVMLVIIITRGADELSFIFSGNLSSIVALVAMSHSLYFSMMSLMSDSLSCNSLV